MVNERRWLVVIFALYLLLAVGYSLLMPIWEAPDEPAHYHIAWSIARRDRYPTLENNYEANQPKAFYYLASWAIRVLDKVNPRFSDYFLPPHDSRNYRKPTFIYDWTDANYRFLLGVYVLRWINILFGACALWLNWKTFQLVAPEKPYARLAGFALAALTPQYLHILSSVNNDGLGVLAGAVLFYLGLSAAMKSSGLLTLTAVILAILLPFVSKLTVLPVGVAVLAILAWEHMAGRKLNSRVLLLTGGALGISILLLTLFVLSPQTIRAAVSEITWRLSSFRHNAFTPKYLGFILGQITWSYWGKVGWLALGLPKWIVIALTALGTAGLILNARGWVRAGRNAPEYFLWLATWTIATFTILAVARNALTTSATQGRFLFPAIGALSLLMVSGWHEVLSPRFQRALPLLVIVAMSGLNLWLWLAEILPIYYQPFLD